MLDKRNGNGNGGNVCMCPGCHYGGRGWTFFLLRALITIIILMFVFWFGVAAGRLGTGYGWDRESMMNGYYGSGGVQTPMMRFLGATSTPSTNGY